MEDGFHQMVWSGANAPADPVFRTGSPDERLRHLLLCGMLFCRLQPPRLSTFTSSTVSCARRVQRFPVDAAPSKPCFNGPVRYSHVSSPEAGAKRIARSAPAPTPTANAVNLFVH